MSTHRTVVDIMDELLLIARRDHQLSRELVERLDALDRRLSRELVERLDALDRRVSLGPKYAVHYSRIVKTSDNKPLPEDEPLFLLRGRDMYALACLQSYLGECLEAHCASRHVTGVRERIKTFQEFRLKCPERMHEPGSQ